MANLLLVNISRPSAISRAKWIVFGLSTLALSGCTSDQLHMAAPLSGTRSEISTGSGTVMSGRQPLSGATIQIYAVGTTGSGSASTPLLTSSPVSDSSGNFTLKSFACPTPTTLIYLTATGGNANTSVDTNNQQITNMVALGLCDTITPYTSITVNEVTTLAATSALAPFMMSYTSVGSSSDDAVMLEDAFTLAAEIANPDTGLTPGVSVPAGQTVPISKIGTLANIFSACISSPGDNANRSSPCGRIFSLTSLADSIPTNTADAMLSLAHRPTENIGPIFQMQIPVASYYPALTSPPLNWSLLPFSPTATPIFLPAPGTYIGSASVTLSAATPSATIYYTTDGSRPTASSTLYTGAFAVVSTSKIRAVAVAAGINSLLVAGSYTIRPVPLHAQKLVFLKQPSSGIVGTTLMPTPVVAIGTLRGVVDRGSNARVTLQLARSSSGGTLSGTTTVSAVNGLASFPGLSIDKPGVGYTLSASENGTLSAISSPFSLMNAVSLTLSSTSVMIGRSATATISLAAPAPPGGLITSIASSNPTIVAVSPASVTIPSGQTQGAFTYSGVSSGAATLSVSVPSAPAANVLVTVAAPVIPATYFGMTTQYYESTQPLVPYGTTRSWDAYYWYFNNTPGLDWPHISLSRGVYNFAALDDFIRINQAGQKQIIYTFGLTPRWASSQPDNNASPYGVGECAPPANMADWDAFVTAIATHAKGNIQYWELWNEPQDSYGYCGDVPTIVTMAQHAYQILKSIDPTNTVLSPAVTSNDGPAWLASYLAAGGARYTDVLAFHGYWSTTAEDITSVVSRYRGVANRYGLGVLPMWDTESSWAGRNGAVGGLTDRSQRAAFLAKSYLLHWSLNVSRFLWYAYDSDPQWGDLWDSATGLHQDGVAYQQVYRWMVGAALTAPCSQDAQLNWSCDLTRPGGYSATILWNSNATPVYTLPDAFIQYRDLQGIMHPVNDHRVTLGNLPVLLETGALP